MWIFFIMLLVIGPRGELRLVDAFGLRLIGITLTRIVESRNVKFLIN